MSDDDFIMTISDGEGEPELVSESDGDMEFAVKVDKPKNNKNRKKKKKAEVAATFDFDDDMDTHPWNQNSDESHAHATLRNAPNASLKEKIANRLLVKKRGKERAERAQRARKAKEAAAKKAQGGGSSDDEDDSEEEDEDEDDSDVQDSGSDENENVEAESGEEEDEEEDEDEEDEQQEEDEQEEEEEEEEEEVKQTKKTKKKKEKKATKKKEVAKKEFSQLKLSRPLLKAIKDLGFIHPTPVQVEAIPVGMSGVDLMVNAQTGSGKTAAFMLPILERLLYRPRRVQVTRVLALTPTRELASQCFAMTQALAKYTDIRICVVVGGLSIAKQELELKSRPDVVIATPGRLIDHLRNTQSVHMEDVEVLILDEADRLLEQGFADEVREIVKACPRGRQTMLFSATMSSKVKDLVELSLNNPKTIEIDPYESIVDNLKQEMIRVKKGKKTKADRAAIVLALCERSFRKKCIVFCKSKADAHRMGIIFGLTKLNAGELHGNLTQTQRLEALRQFKNEEVDVLLCTDLASRGLDIKGVETVINMSLPRQYRQYVHRVGRTARAGKSGCAVSLVGEDQRKMLKEIVKKAKDAVQSRVIPQAVVSKYRDLIESYEDDIKIIMEEERLEKYNRIAEMEANKAQNMMRYEQEIASRPQRTWFQSQHAKDMASQSGIMQFNRMGSEKQAREDAKKAAEAKKKKDKDPLKGLSRRKRRRKLMQMELEREKAADSEHYHDIQASLRRAKARAKELGSAAPVGGKSKEAVSQAEWQAQQKERKQMQEAGIDPLAGFSNSKKRKLKKKANQLEAVDNKKKKAKLKHLRYNEEESQLVDKRFRVTKKEIREKDAKPQKTAKQKRGGKSVNAFKSLKRYKRR